MALQNVPNRSGERFSVAGNWLVDTTFDESVATRTFGGTFRMTVLADSISEAINKVSMAINKDIIVTGAEQVR